MKKIKWLKFKTKKKKLELEDLSKEDIEKELHREKYKNSFNRVLKSTIYILIFILAASSIIVTLFMPVLEVNDGTMKPTVNNKEIVLTLKYSNIKRGDVIAFYHGNKILIKRVIGLSGDWINIDINGNVFVNGEKLKENYVSESIKGNNTIDFPVQVPSERVFVLSDERDKIIDSRNEEIGYIKKEDIIGKVIFRVWPIKKIGSI